jgi:hydrogenase maturation factor
MKKYKIEFDYIGIKTTVDLRCVGAVSRPKSGKFLIYFENAIWSVNESEFENVYNAWMAI